MTKITDIPAIRFKGFSDTWEQRKLSDVVDSVDTGKSKFDKEGSSGEYPILGSTSVIGYDDEYDYEGDFILTARVGANAGSLYRHAGKVKISDNTVYIQASQNIEFLYQLLIRFDIKRLSFGTGQPLVKASELKRLELMMPTDMEEQMRIGVYFKNLDHLITLHQRKYDKLTNVKKSMLGKMFPQNGSNVPEIRFKGFTEAWEQRKLSEIATMHARIGWQNLRTSEFLDNGDYMLITGTDFMDGAVNFDTCHYVERERYEQDKHIQIRNGSILITKDGTLGKVAYIQGLTMPATLNAGVFNVEIRDEKEVDNRYLFQYLKAPFLMDYVDKKATGGTIKHLNQNILVDFPVVLPQKDEQAKIGEYFLGIDNLITLHQRELEKLKNLKKACLEKMFV